ncbi:hypothetical protein SAMN05216486_10361 [bacterium JGI 053]|nr:hypothetical protein SAMN05216486_10361 [bacterium JGI 053]
MLEALTLRNVIERRELLRDEFDRLMSYRNVAGKPNAKQWDFLRFAFEALLAMRNREHPCDRRTAAQYVHEVNKRLGEHYGSRGPAVSFLFRLVPIRQAIAQKIVEKWYPSVNGYALVVNEWVDRRTDEDRAQDLIERTVMELMQAEFEVYCALPQFDLAPIRGRVLEDSQIHKLIAGVAERNSARGWTISNPRNPSNMRLLDIKVRKLTAERAEVVTKEYWLLDYWSIRLGRYVRPHYQQTNRQKYAFVNREGRWVADSNLRPPPAIFADRVKA